MNTTLPQILEDAHQMILGLKRMKTFDATFGYPSRQFDSVHIGGTNGKGSVATKIASAFPGKKVGLFTSPHIHTWRERVQINGELIPEEVGERLLNQIAMTLDQRATFFELLTLLAFIYFAEEKVELAVLEVGLGGRLDATNIVTPLVSVITSIDIEHTKYLGNTLESIAYEKGGIIKPGVPVVVGPSARFYPDNEYLFEVMGTFAHYEEENQAIARQALKLLGVEKTDVSNVPPCRFEQIGNVILDVAHNPAALKRTFERIAYTYPAKKVRAIVAFSDDKDIPACLEIIRQHTRAYHLVKIDHARAYIPEDALRLEEALKLAQENELILVCGTFFMMAEVKAILKRELGSD